ncbi:hypothetical protein PCE1_001056 [Barthelona sp. PCE]
MECSDGLSGNGECYDSFTISTFIDFLEIMLYIFIGFLVFYFLSLCFKNKTADDDSKERIYWSSRINNSEFSDVQEMDEIFDYNTKLQKREKIFNEIISPGFEPFPGGEYFYKIKDEFYLNQKLELCYRLNEKDLPLKYTNAVTKKLEKAVRRAREDINEHRETYYLSQLHHDHELEIIEEDLRSGSSANTTPVKNSIILHTTPALNDSFRPLKFEE